MGIWDGERVPFMRLHVAMYCTVWNYHQLHVLLLLLFLKLTQMSKKKFQGPKARLHGSCNSWPAGPQSARSPAHSRAAASLNGNALSHTQQQDPELRDFFNRPTQRKKGRKQRGKQHRTWPETRLFQETEKKKMLPFLEPGFRNLWGFSDPLRLPSLSSDGKFHHSKTESAFCVKIIRPLCPKYF